MDYLIDVKGSVIGIKKSQDFFFLCSLVLIITSNIPEICFFQYRFQIQNLHDSPPCCSRAL